MIIKLTEATATQEEMRRGILKYRDVFINTACISYVAHAPDVANYKSLVSLNGDGVYFYVQETPEEIQRLVNEIAARSFARPLGR